MSLSIVEYTYAANSAAARDEHRPAHRAWLSDLVERGVVLSSGPTTDGSGAFIIVNNTDSDAISILFTHDPFATAGLVDEVRIVGWNPVLGQFS